MKKHTTLYVLGGALLLVGAYMYMSKNKSNKMNTTPPMVAEDTTPAPAPANTGNTLSGASQVIDSLKGLLAEIKNKSQNAVKKGASNFQ
jgi:hypothetical protein